MKREYDGLKAFKISVNNEDIITASTDNCSSMVQLRMENGICVSPPEQQQVEYTSPHG